MNMNLLLVQQKIILNPVSTPLTPIVMNQDENQSPLGLHLPPLLEGGVQRRSGGFGGDLELCRRGHGGGPCQWHNEERNDGQAGGHHGGQEGEDGRGQGQGGGHSAGRGERYVGENGERHLQAHGHVRVQGSLVTCGQRLEEGMLRGKWRGGDRDKGWETNQSYNCIFPQRQPLAQIGVNGSLKTCDWGHRIQVAGSNMITPAAGRVQMVQDRHTPVHMTPVTMNEAIKGVDSGVIRRKKKLLVPKSLIPPNQKMITDQLAREHWEYANHFDKNLPKNNPEETHLWQFVEMLVRIRDFMYTKIHDRMLEHLQSVARKHGIFATYFSKSHSSKNIESIHKAVLSSTDRYTDAYLKMVLEFFKLPLKQEREWLRLAEEDVQAQYDILFEWGKPSFVQAYANATFNDSFNQRLKRGMKKTGVVWYDRVPNERNRRTLFGDDMTEVINKSVFFGPMVIHGHLLKVVEVKEEEKEKPLPTGWQQKLLESETQEDFVQCAKDFWTDIMDRKASSHVITYLYVHA